MMKWGRKPSPTYFINHVFPISWLKKLKRKGGSFHPGTKQPNQKAKVPEMTRCSSMPTKFKEGRFYSGRDDLYWRLSFGDESFEEKKGRDVRSIRYNSDDEFNVPKSTCKSSRSRSWDANRQRFTDTIPEIKDISQKQYKVKNTQEKYEVEGLNAREQRPKAPVQNVRKDQEESSFNKRVLKQKKSIQERTIRSERKDIYATKQLKTVKIRNELQKSGVLDYRSKRNIHCPSCSARMSEENCIADDSGMEDFNAYLEEEFSPEMQNLEPKKLNEIISKTEHHRLSVHLSRPVRIKGRKANRKINSPTRRNASKTECKTREAEFKENEKRMKRITKDRDVVAEAMTSFDSYAVHKSSYDPQQDFRDSMIEMIIEKGIKQPEELEELLVCYLAQNCDEYHDLIIKVFQQVWFDLNQVSYAAAW